MKALPPENDLSRRYLRMLEAWLPFGVTLFEEWPERPGCGHFLSGAHWYGLETSGPAFALAVAAAADELDEARAGVTRQRLREMSLASVRYLCFTHDTGPAECVRPDDGLGDPRNFGQKWGERGTTYFKESQCGRSTAPMAAACRLLGDAVDDETHALMLAVQQDYLQRFGDMEPRNGVYIDTQMEENGWTAEGLAGAGLYVADGPGDWEAAARRWMFSTCAAPQDVMNFGELDGVPVHSHTGKIVTALPDYWAENHRMVHPSYTAAGVKFTLYIANLLGLWGCELPPQLLWNRDKVYNNLKAVTDGGGYPMAVQGMDWPYLPLVGNEAIHAVGSVLFDDAEAAALQRRALKIAETRQAGQDGRLVPQEIADKAREKDRATILREAGVAEIANLYLFHRLFGEGAAPVADADVPARLNGVRQYAHAGFVHHRHDRGMTSLSWRNEIMALPLTAEGIFTVAPARGSWLAHAEVEGYPDSHELRDLHVDDESDRFVAYVGMDRCQGALRQDVLFASLPDGRVLTWERLTAQRDCDLRSLEQGFLRITNESFPAMNNGCRGERVLTTPAGATTYKGWVGTSPDQDIVGELARPAWVNIDDRLGIRLVGNGPGEYRNRHFWEAYQVVADDLVLSMTGPRSLQAGDTAGELAALLTPGQSASETEGTSFGVVSTDDSVILRADGWLCAVQLADGPSQVEWMAQVTEDVYLPVYEGVTTDVDAGTVTRRMKLTGRRPRLLREVARVQVSGACWLEATATALYINAAGGGCQIRTSEGDEVSLDAWSVERIELSETDKEN